MAENKQRQQTITVKLSPANFIRLRKWGVAYKTRPRSQSDGDASGRGERLTQGEIVEFGLEIIHAAGVNFGEGRPFSELRKETLDFVKNASRSRRR
jgi:hypothetical protein